MKTLIIAEAGVNHNGDLALAKKMAVVAKNAGADIVKYQTAVPELVISKFAEKADYQKVQTGDHETPVSYTHLTAAGAKRRLLIGIVDSIVLLQIVEVALDHVLFVVDHQREIPASKALEPVDDVLGNRQLSHRNQRFWQNLGIGIQPGAKPAGHDQDVYKRQAQGRAARSPAVSHKPAAAARIPPGCR